MNKKPNEYAELSSNEELSLVLTRYASIKGMYCATRLKNV